MSADILVVDDEADIRELIAGILQDEGYETRLAHNSDAALMSIADRRPSLVILDIWLQGSKLDGLDLLNAIKEKHPELPVVIISGHGNIETAVSAIRRGAYDYIEKPFKADRLILVVGRALETSRLKRENEELKGRAGTDVELSGNSAAMRQLRQTLKKVAPANSRVLISGPMGAGKELAARTLHTMSRGSRAPSSSCPRPRSRRSAWKRNCSASRIRAAECCGSARLKRPMAERSISTKSPTCRSKPRARCCGCSSIRLSSG